MIKRTLKALLIAAAALFIFSGDAYASDKVQAVLYKNTDGDVAEFTHTIDFRYVKETDRRAEFLVNFILENNIGRIYASSDNMELLWLNVNEGTVFLNFDKRVDYGGGLNDYLFAKQLSKTLLNLDNIQNIVVMSDSVETNLSEGIDWSKV